MASLAAAANGLAGPKLCIKPSRVSYKPTNSRASSLRLLLHHSSPKEAYAQVLDNRKWHGSRLRELPSNRICSPHCQGPSTSPETRASWQRLVHFDPFLVFDPSS